MVAFCPSMRRRGTALALAALLIPAGAGAQDGEGRGLRYEASLDVPLTVVGLAGTIAPSLLTDSEGTWTCRWCDRDGAGNDTLNGLDAATRRHLRWSHPEKAHEWSNVALAGSVVVPAAAFIAVRGGVSDGLGGETLLVLESSAVALALTQATKYGFRRARPWAHFGVLPAGEHLGSREGALSFVSGHASLSFAFAVSTGSLASLRGDDGKAWVWAGGLTFAAASSYLRIAADRHYLTDVLAGAALGATVGWVVPRLIDRKPAADATVESRARERATPVPLLHVALAPGRTGTRLVVTGGVQGGGPFVSATWRF
jgi:membrane-associated phospholipid phosphatase